MCLSAAQEKLAEAEACSTVELCAAVPGGACVEEIKPPLWRVHGEWYDLRSFASVHPGGSLAIELAQGTDASSSFEQFHVMSESHRLALAKHRVTPPAGGGAAQTERVRSAFHEDLKVMVRGHFAGRGRFAHKASSAHLRAMSVVLSAYACAWVGWWRGDVLVGGVVLPVLAWLQMANMAHDGSHCAASRFGLLNELWLLTSSPLLYSYASWYLQHCVSHHQHTNELANDADVVHHPFARWHKDALRDRVGMTGGVNLLWHATAFLVSTLNMSLVHPWKFVVVPFVRLRLLGQRALPPEFSRDNAAYCGALAARGRDVPHELAFHRAAGVAHVSGVFLRDRRCALALGSWLSALFFLARPFLAFGASRRALALALLPYAISSLLFMVVTQISHVQAVCQTTRATGHADFFKRQAMTSLDYSTDSQLVRFLTGGLNVQSIHHVFPGISCCHYTDLYPKFAAICKKHDCQPATRPNVAAALADHLAHVFNLGQLYRYPTPDL